MIFLATFILVDNETWRTVRTVVWKRKFVERKNGMIGIKRKEKTEMIRKLERKKPEG